VYKLYKYKHVIDVYQGHIKMFCKGTHYKCQVLVMTVRP